MQESRLSFILTSFFLTLALGTWLLASSLAATVGKPEQTKDLLKQSGLYQAVIPAQVADVQRANPSLASVPLDNPEIQKILGSSLDAKNVEQQGDKAIDAIYAWLEGKSETPQIDITVMADQQRLATAAGNYVAKYVSGLPACAPGEADYAAFSTNPLEATCMPPGTDAQMVRSSVEQAILSNPALGASTQLTEEDVRLANGKTIMESLGSAPTWYQRAVYLPLIAAILIAFFAIVLLFVVGVRSGVKSIGKHALSVGITLAVVAIALAWAMEKSLSTFVPKSDNPNVGDALMRLSNLFNAAYRDNIIQSSLYLVAGGAVLLIVGILLTKLLAKSKLPPSITSTTDTLAAEPPKTSFTPAPAAPAKTTKKKTTRKKKPVTKKKK